MRCSGERLRSPSLPPPSPLYSPPPPTLGGNETLCAIGSEIPNGDKHYVYRNAKHFKKFGAISCHNRRELLAW